MTVITQTVLPFSSKRGTSSAVSTGKGLCEDHFYSRRDETVYLYSKIILEKKNTHAYISVLINIQGLTKHQTLQCTEQ